VIWRKTLKIESNTDGAVKAAAAIRLELEKGNRALEERLRELIIKGQADKDLAAKAVTDVQAKLDKKKPSLSARPPRYSDLLTERLGKEKTSETKKDRKKIFPTTFRKYPNFFSTFSNSS
jgi:hypothetical protein